MTHPGQYARAAKVTGKMPPYHRVAEAIWGGGADFDSDGDSSNPEDSGWRELTLILRPGYDQRLDIDPIEDDRETVVLRATSRDVLERAVNFLESVGALTIVDDKS